MLDTAAGSAAQKRRTCCAGSGGALSILRTVPGSRPRPQESRSNPPHGKIFVDELSRWTFSPSPVRSFGTRQDHPGKGLHHVWDGLSASTTDTSLALLDCDDLGRAPSAQRRKCICGSASATAANVWAYLAPTSGMEFRLGGIGRFLDAHVLADFTITVVVTLASKVSRPFRGLNLRRRLFNHS